HENHAAAMDYGISEDRVCIVFGIKEVELRIRMPLAKPNAGLPLPAKRTGRIGLILAIDHDRAMGRSAAEEVAPLQFGGVGVGPGIHQTRLAENRALHAQ